jgi:hypothetical protein
MRQEQKGVKASTVDDRISPWTKSEKRDREAQVDNEERKRSVQDQSRRPVHPPNDHMREALELMDQASPRSETTQLLGVAVGRRIQPAAEA